MSKKAAKAEKADDNVSAEFPHQHGPFELGEDVKVEIVQSVGEYVLGRMLACGSCKFWARTGLSFGQCMLSGKVGSAPIVTTDKASCSSWAE